MIRLLAVRVLAALGLLLAGVPAFAAVEIGFYSRELGGNNFPHAFIRLTGTVDSTGQAVDIAYGFTARAVTPALLFGAVSGEVMIESEARVRASDRQFRLTLTDEQYATVLRVVQQWRDLPQPSYSLGRANCIHFVAAVAAAIGLRVELVRGLMRRPRSFLIHQRGLNEGRVSPG
jgi:hypothetical protein